MTLNLDIEICAMGNINFTIGQVLFFSFKAQLLLNILKQHSIACFRIPNENTCCQYGILK